MCGPSAAASRRGVDDCSIAGAEHLAIVAIGAQSARRADGATEHAPRVGSIPQRRHASRRSAEVAPSPL